MKKAKRSPSKIPPPREPEKLVGRPKLRHFKEVKLPDHPRVSMDPAICHGKPVIAGTRVLVSNILGSLAGGQTTQKILEDYPNVTAEDVEACLAFASSLAQFETLPDDVALA